MLRFLIVSLLLACILLEELYAAAVSTNKRLVIVKGANHAELFDTPETVNAVRSFLSSLDHEPNAPATARR